MSNNVSNIMSKYLGDVADKVPEHLQQIENGYERRSETRSGCEMTQQPTMHTKNRYILKIASTPCDAKLRWPLIGLTCNQWICKFEFLKFSGLREPAVIN